MGQRPVVTRGLRRPRDSARRMATDLTSFSARTSTVSMPDFLPRAGSLCRSAPHRAVDCRFTPECGAAGSRRRRGNCQHRTHLRRTGGRGAGRAARDAPLRREPRQPRGPHRHEIQRLLLHFQARLGQHASCQLARANRRSGAVQLRGVGPWFSVTLSLAPFDGGVTLGVQTETDAAVVTRNVSLAPINWSTRNGVILTGTGSAWVDNILVEAW